MADPSAQSIPSDPGPPLTHARPDIAQRLTRHPRTATPDGPPLPGPPVLRKPGRLPLLKRMERYLSAVLKLGRTYGTVKETTRYLGGYEARLDGIAGAIGSIGDRQNHDGDRLHDLEAAEAEAMAAEAMAAGDPGDDIDAMRAVLDDRMGDLENRLERKLLDTGDRTGNAVDRLRTEIAETAGEMHDRFATVDVERAGLSRAYGDLSRRLDMARGDGEALPVPPPEMSGLDALMESFYARLEDRYRGSREEIRQRLVQYVPEAEAATERTGKPVLDLGCGRGEWLQLLRGHGIAGTGVDLNEMQLREARALDLDVHLTDACRFLADAPDGSYGMITAHHLAEHLPFRTLVWMTREAMRVLAPGGILLYETPNIGNILVGASSFHIDPTHVRPLPVQVLTTLYDTLGFHPVESRFLHPSPTHDAMVRGARLDPGVAHLLFGPQDLAVLGTKPGGAA